MHADRDGIRGGLKTGNLWHQEARGNFTLIDNQTGGYRCGLVVPPQPTNEVLRHFGVDVDTIPRPGEGIADSVVPGEPRWRGAASGRRCGS